MVVKWNQKREHQRSQIGEAARAVLQQAVSCRLSPRPSRGAAWGPRRERLKMQLRQCRCQTQPVRTAVAHTFSRAGDSAAVQTLQVRCKIQSFS